MTISDEELEAAAKAPRKTVGDEGSVEEKKIDELIRADQYLADKQTNAQVPPFGMRMARMKPRGTV